MASKLGLTLLSLVTFLLWVWLIPAVWYAPLSVGVLTDIGAGAVGIVPPLALLFVPNRKRTLVVTFGVLALLFAAWSAIPATGEGDWAPEYARMPTAEVDGDRLTVRNIRNFEYRTETDFTPRWYDATYDLNELETLDFAKVHWDGLVNIAHTMLSFGFSDGRYLAVSAETRRREGQGWSSIEGFFKQYELTYVLGDELDLFRLRTNFRGEQVYLYRTNTSKQDIRSMLLDILGRADSLARQPEFYNTITDNCTTSLASHIRKIRGRRRWDPRLLLNGHTDEMGLETGWITSDLPLEEMRAAHLVNRLVEGVDDPTDYSKMIRPAELGF
jgi:hypothetical protein